MLGLRDDPIADCNYAIRDYRQGGTRLFSEVPNDRMKDCVYKLDGLQLLFCDFIPPGTPMAARKLLSLAFQVKRIQYATGMSF